MAESYNANEVIGKTLYAKSKVDVFTNWLYPTTVAYTVPAGGMVGVVYSWIKKGSDIWWQIETSGGANNAFVKHVVNLFDTKSLQDQGAESTEQKAAEQKAAEEAAKEDAKSFSTKMFDFLTKNIKTVAIIGGVAAIGVALIKTRKSK